MKAWPKLKKKKKKGRKSIQQVFSEVSFFYLCAALHVSAHRLFTCKSAGWNDQWNALGSWPLINLTLGQNRRF